MTLGRRIMIIGSGGAGKSTLARQLGERLGLPVIHLDREHWQPGWVEPPRAEWEARVAELVAGERWIIDGNYGGTVGLRLAAADTVIFLDFPRVLCVWRVVQRFLAYRGRSRPDMTPGCPEQLDAEFLRWIWHVFPRKTRPTILNLLTEHGAGKSIHILRTPRQVAALLASMATTQSRE